MRSFVVWRQKVAWARTPDRVGPEAGQFVWFAIKVERRAAGRFSAGRHAGRFVARTFRNSETHLASRNYSSVAQVLINMVGEPISPLPLFASWAAPFVFFLQLRTVIQMSLSSYKGVHPRIANISRVLLKQVGGFHSNEIGQ